MMPPLVQLGKTDLRVSPIGLGCWQFSGGKGVLARFWPVLDQEQVNAIVSTAVSAGCNWFDTAEGYGWGHSERSLDHALRQAETAGVIPGPPVIATKWWPLLRFASSLRSGVEDRRKALGGRIVDLHQIHQRTSLSSLAAQMDVLADLVAAGHARAVGVSNFGARAMLKCAELLDARGVPLASNQVCYNLVDRRIEKNGVLAEAERAGITIIAYSPLAQGILTGRYHPKPDRDAEPVTGPRRRMPAFRTGRLRAVTTVVSLLRSLAREHDCTPAQIALAWVTQRRPGVVVAIPGATTTAQAEQNARSMEIRLPREEILRLDAVSDPAA